MNATPAAVPSIFLHPAFWAAVSILSAFLLTWFLLDRPRKWWVLLAAAIAAFFLFDWFGLGGFMAAFALKLWRENEKIKTATPTTPQAAARKKRRHG